MLADRKRAALGAAAVAMIMGSSFASKSVDAAFLYNLSVSNPGEDTLAAFTGSGVISLPSQEGSGIEDVEFNFLVDSTLLFGEEEDQDVAFQTSNLSSLEWVLKDDQSGFKSLILRAQVGDMGPPPDIRGLILAFPALDGSGNLCGGNTPEFSDGYFCLFTGEPGSGFYLGDLTITQIPLPGAAVFLLTALIGLVGLHVRHRAMAS
jgi:hypothetical protein